jgi:chemotaxis protein CheC
VQLERELDRLCELANVGAGHAAGALAQLVGHPIRMTVPRIHPDAAGPAPSPGKDDPATGIFFEVEGGMGGVFGVLLPARVCEALLASLLGASRGKGASEESVSALREVGNILASHALSAVADMLGDRVLPSVPLLEVDPASLLPITFRSSASLAQAHRIEIDLVDSAGSPCALLVWIPAC